MHGRTYKQAFEGKADFTGIYELKQHLDIPVIANGDIMDYADGMKKIIHPANQEGGKNLDGFMIGRACFGNPWCFLADGHKPSLRKILEVMELHAKLLIETK